MSAMSASCPTQLGCSLVLGLLQTRCQAILPIPTRGIWLLTLCMFIFPRAPGFRLTYVISGHNITEIAFDGTKIAGAKSHDFFGDGSMFLLDAPGVSIYIFSNLGFSSSAC
jgi:hypothetical protein